MRYPNWAARLVIGLIGPLLGGCVGNPPAVTVSSLAGLQRAIDNADAGETVVLAPGVYAQTRAITVDHKHNLTITGATDDTADTVLRGPGMNDKRLISNIRLDNADHITLKNFTVRDSYDHGVQINNDSDGFVADNLRTLDNGESGFKITSPSHAHGASAYSDNGTIENSFIGFSKAKAGQRSVVEGVDIVAGNNWHLRGNRFERIRRADGGPAYAAFAKGNAHGAVFVANVVADCFLGLSFGGGGTNRIYFRNGDTRFETRGGVIRGNVIRDTDDAGIYLNQAHGFVVQDNTVLRNGRGTGAIESRFPGSRGTIRGNRVSGPIKTRDGGHAIIEDNHAVAPDAPLPKSARG